MSHHSYPYTPLPSLAPPGPVGFWRRLTALLAALGALAVSVAFLVAAPVAMWRGIGWPLPRHIPTWDGIKVLLGSPFAQDFLLDVLACLFWYLYLVLVLSFASEAAMIVVDWRHPRPRTRRRGQTLAAALLGTIIAGMITVAARSKPLPTTTAGELNQTSAAYRAPIVAAAPADPTPPATPTPAVFVRTTPNVVQPVGYTQPAGPGVNLPTMLVARYDSLWGLAHTHLGDGLRWRQIYQLNEGRPQPDGGRLANPDLIRPGWILRLPADAVVPQDPTEPATTNPPDGATAGTGPAAPAGPAAPDTPATAPSAPPTATPWIPPVSTVAPSSPAGASPARGTSSAPAAPAPTSHPTPAAPHVPVERRTIRLPSGAVLPTTLIAAIIAAVTIARLLRTRRRTPTRPGQPVPTAPSLPVIVREILGAGTTMSADDEEADLWPGHPRRGDHDSVTGHPGHPGHPQPSDPTAVPSRPRADLPASDGQEPSTPVGRPATPPLGSGGMGEPVPSEVALLPGTLVRAGRLGLDGPGAPAAARAILTSLLTDHYRHRNRPDRPWPGRLLIPAADVDRLGLPADLLAVLPQVTIVDSAGAAADRLEAEALYRQRMMATSGTDTIDALRQAVPDEMFPTVLLVTSVEETLAGRTGTANGHGRQLGLFTLALGHWPAQLTVTLDSDGTQTAPAGGRGDAWWQLTAASAADLLRLAAAAQDIHLPDEATPPVFSTATPAPAVTPAPARPAVERRVRLVLFGRPTLVIDGRLHTKGVLTKSLEIAAYLAFHSDGVSGDQLAGELLPDREPAKAANQIYRAVGALRGEIRQATGDRDTVFVAGGKTGYRLNPDHVTVDLWEFGTAERTAGHARDDPARIAALTTAAELARNRPLADVGYNWAAGYVADLEHRITGVLADLADLYADDNPDRALAYLEQAIVLTPHVEDLYAHMMRIHAARGRTDAVRRTYQRLADALEHLGLDVDPTPETQALLARLTRTQQATPPPGAGHTGPRRIIRPAVPRPVDPPIAGS